MLAALLWLPFGMLVALIILGAIPIICEFCVSRDTQTRVRVDLLFLGGRMRGIPIFDSDKPRKPRARLAEKRRKPKSRKPARRPNPAMVKDLVVDLLGRIQFNRLSVDGRFGTGDPAETGEIYGSLTPLIYRAESSFPRLSIEIQPVFGAACLEGQIIGRLRVTPLALVPPLTRFGWRLSRA